jgi:DNA primase
LQRAILKAEPLSEYLWRYEVGLAGNISTPEGRAQLKERLQELAQSIGNAALSHEYRKAFNDRFFETFGWKRREVEEAARAIVASTPEREVAFWYTLMRAVLLGLSRFPEVLRANLEAACELRLSDYPHLESWRNVLVSAVEERPLLDEDLINAILESAALSPIEKRSITKDFAFSFFKRSNDPERSQSDLAKVVNTIVIEQELDDEVQSANERLMAEVEEAPWQNQLRLRADRDRMKERLRTFVESEGLEHFGT